MKKILLLIAIALMYIGVQAQNATIDKTLSYDQTYVNYNGQTADSIGVIDTTWTYTVRKNNHWRVFPYVYLALDSIGGTAADVTVLLQKKVFGDQDYTTETTVTYAGTADTVILFDVTTADKAEFWRVSLSKASNDFNIGVEDLNFKFPY